MKICVLSDSHGSRNSLEDFLKENYFDYVFFLGDGLRDFEKINNENIKLVAGNCDFFSNEPLVEVLNLQGVTFLLTHGHNYHVKQGLYGLNEFAKKRNANVVCFGHTHCQKLETIDDITFLNPGSFKNGDYAIITLDKSSHYSITLEHHR